MKLETSNLKLVGLFLPIPLLILAFLATRYLDPTTNTRDSSLTSLVGPAGDAHRACIQEISDADRRTLLLCVWDWPHTLLRPIILGNVGFDATDLHWSNDGSLLLYRTIDRDTPRACSIHRLRLHHPHPSPR